MGDLVDGILSELIHLQEGEKLLLDVFLHLGPYTDQLPSKLLDGIRTHFKFDDGE